MTDPDLKPLPDIATPLSRQPTVSNERQSLREVATRSVRVLMGCYADFGRVDPDIFTAGMRELFAMYPAHIQRAVADPATGLPSTSKWLPTIAEAREALDRAMQAERDRLDREARYRARQEAAATPKIEFHAKPEAERRAIVSKLWRTV
jgi:hypothetical protein